MKVLITGASGKLGEELAVCFALAGAKIALGYRRGAKKASRLAADLKKIECMAIPIGADLSTKKGCTALVECAAKALGGLDAVVHAAAEFSPTKFESASQKDFERFFSANALSAFFIGRAAKKVMRRGGIVFISDAAAKHPYGEFVPYCTSKGALDSLTAALAKKLSPKISVNAIAPYLVDNGKKPGAHEQKLIKKIRLGNAATTTDVATLAIWLCTQRSTTGQVFNLDGGRFL